MDQKNNSRLRQQPNKLCTSCRRTCKQVSAAIIAQCPRYYPYHRKQSPAQFTWKQMELGF